MVRALGGNDSVVVGGHKNVVRSQGGTRGAQDSVLTPQGTPPAPPGPPSDKAPSRARCAPVPGCLRATEGFAAVNL